MPDARRTHSLACEMMEAHEHNHHRFAENTPTFPARWFTAYNVLPGDRALLPPSPAGHTCKLDPSVGGTGPHDFAVRVGVARLATPSASIASRTNVRDDAYAPCVRKFWQNVRTGGWSRTARCWN
jgi:hypothetical protein